MRNIVTVEKIKETATYKELESKKDITKCNFLIQRVIREKISHAVQVYNNTGFIPQTVSSFYLEAVKDIIKESQDNDASRLMTAENVVIDCKNENKPCSPNLKYGYLECTDC